LSQEVWRGLGYTPEAADVLAEESVDRNVEDLCVMQGIALFDHYVWSTEIAVSPTLKNVDMLLRVAIQEALLPVHPRA
jgi:hypothetical protein